MGISMPPELDWLFKIAAGQAWPKGDEDKLRSLGEVWVTHGRHLSSIVSQVDPLSRGVLESMSGAPHEAFGEFVSNLKRNLPDMAEAAGNLGTMSKSTATEVQYAKLMIISQLALLAYEIAQFIAEAPETFGASLALIPPAIAATRLAVAFIAKGLITAILRETAIQLGLDVVIQGLQMLTGNRAEWNVGNTIGAAVGGALSGVVGGLFHGIGGAYFPKFADSFTGHITSGAVNGAVVTAATNTIFHSDGDVGLGALSGGFGGIFGKRGHGAGGTGEHTHLDGTVPHLDKPDLIGGLGKHGTNLDVPHVESALPFTADTHLPPTEAPSPIAHLTGPGHDPAGRGSTADGAPGFGTPASSGPEHGGVGQPGPGAGTVHSGAATAVVSEPANVHSGDPSTAGGPAAHTGNMATAEGGPPATTRGGAAAGAGASAVTAPTEPARAGAPVVTTTVPGRPVGLPGLEPASHQLASHPVESAPETHPVTSTGPASETRPVEPAGSVGAQPVPRSVDGEPGGTVPPTSTAATSNGAGGQAGTHAAPPAPAYGHSGFHSAHDVAGRWDAAPPTETRAERFEADTLGKDGAGLLHGWITQIGYDQRRFQLGDGQWVRDFEIRMDLRAGAGAKGADIPAMRQRLTDAVNDHLNQKYRLPNGDQFNVTLTFTSDDPHATVTLHGKPDTNQTHFSTAAPDGILVHEVLHYLGLPEGYHDPDALLRRQLDPAGPMGEHAARGDWTLSAGQLARIDEIAHHGPSHDLPADFAGRHPALDLNRGHNRPLAAPHTPAAAPWNRVTPNDAPAGAVPARVSAGSAAVPPNAPADTQR